MLVRAKSVFWKIYSPIALGLGFGMLGILCAFWMPFAFVLNYVLPEKSRHVIGRLAIRIGLNFYLFFLSLFCGCRFNFAITRNDLSNKAGVIVANHPSLLDAVLLLALIPNTVCVMKSSLLDNPFLGASARLAGFIRNSDPFDMITHAKQVADEGTNLLLFPEGTRSLSMHKVNTLNQSAALLSSKLNLPIRAFIITYDQSFLGKVNKVTSIPSLPMKISVRVGKVFYPSTDNASVTQDLENYINGEI